MQACAAPNMDASRTDKPAPDGSSDMYGINIPVELCEDASLDFALNVNAFMEAKFEVPQQYIWPNFLFPCHRGKNAARRGTRTLQQRTRRF